MGDNTHECTVGGNAYAVMWEGKDDDNGGLIYGIEYMDGEEVSDVEWFKTSDERDAELKQYISDAGCEGIMKPIDFSKSDDRLFNKAWSVVKGDDFERKQFDAKMHKGGKKHSCPTCKQPKRLSDEQKKRRYQCDECADKEEGAY
tara:strand:+ start:1267 stop:1701 length:435 start_codon:yes stop_codon:yes gene_type:complete